MNIYTGALALLLCLFICAGNVSASQIIEQPKTTKRQSNGDQSNRVSDAELLTLKVRRLLNDKKFDELNRMLSDFQESAEANINNENMLLVAYEAFGTNDMDYAELLSLWVEKYPTQYQPYVARTAFEYSKAWYERGTQWSSETSEEQLVKMREHLTIATTNAQEALKLNNKAIIPYYFLIGITNTQGDDEGVMMVATKALQLYPSSYVLRKRYLNTLQPRWGGSYEKMEKFVVESSAYIEHNPKLELLGGFVFADAANMRAITQNYSTAEEYFTIALEFGGNHEIYYRRAGNRKKLKKYQDALDDINRAIELHPFDGLYYYHRADIYEELKQDIKAVPDIKLAYALSPNAKYITEFIDRLATGLISDAFKFNEKKQHQLANQYIDSAIALKEEDANGYYWRSRMLIKQNRRNAALEDIRKAVALDNSKLNYYRTLDWLLAKQYRWDEIISHWDDFIERNPDNSEAYVERGGAFFHKGDLESAMRDAKTAADMGSHEGQEAYEKFNYTLTPQGKITYYVRSLLSNEWTIPIFAFILVLSIFLKIIQMLRARINARATS